MTYNDFIKKVPIFGEFFKIMNAYAFKGDVRYLTNIAPLNLWCNRILKRMAMVAFLPLALALFTEGESLQVSPVDLITSGYPSLLGFGIGIYALLFTIPEQLLENLCVKVNKKKVSLGILNVDMAYPLCVLICTLVIAYISSLTEGSAILNYINQFLLFYGAAVMFELISSVFNVAQSRLVDIEKKLKDKESIGNEKSD